MNSEGFLKMGLPVISRHISSSEMSNRPVIEDEEPANEDSEEESSELTDVDDGGKSPVPGTVYSPKEI